jgi:hypothetical protein
LNPKTLKNRFKEMIDLVEKFHLENLEPF